MGRVVQYSHVPGEVGADYLLYKMKLQKECILLGMSVC